MSTEEHAISFIDYIETKTKEAMNALMYEIGNLTVQKILNKRGVTGVQQVMDTYLNDNKKHYMNKINRILSILSAPADTSNYVKDIIIESPPVSVKTTTVDRGLEAAMATADKTIKEAEEEITQDTYTSVMDTLKEVVKGIIAKVPSTRRFSTKSNNNDEFLDNIKLEVIRQMDEEMNRGLASVEEDLQSSLIPLFEAGKTVTRALYAIEGDEHLGAPIGNNNNWEGYGGGMYRPRRHKKGPKKSRKHPK